MTQPSELQRPDVQSYGAARVSALPTGPLQENAVLVWDSASTQGFLIDPGDEAAQLLAWVREMGVQVQAILLTHAHFDHIGAVEPLRRAFNAAVHLHPLDLPLYQAGAQSARRWNLPFVQPSAPEHFITQGQAFTVGAVNLIAREVPGHAPGHVVFVGEGFAVVGDTLFAGSVGRTDLPGSNHPQLLSGIRAELLSLPPQTALYPGHGPCTTVEREALSNPFLQPG